MSDPRVAIQRSLGRASNYNGWIADQIREHAGRRLLDAGCGSGNLTHHLVDRDLVVAVDVWPDCVQAMNERFHAAGNVRVIQSDLADAALGDRLRPHRLDSAFCCNVLEHVEDDRQVLRMFAETLVPGSPVFLLVPAFPLLFGAHDRADHHLRRYTKRSLAAKVANVPLAIESMHYMNFPGFFAWLLLTRMLGRQLDAASIGLYDRCVIPVARAVEDRAAPPIGQSLVAVLRTTPP